MSAARSACRPAGEHTRAELLAAGLDAAQLEALVRSGAAVCAGAGNDNDNDNDKETT